MVDFYGFHVGKYTIVPWILWEIDYTEPWESCESKAVSLESHVNTLEIAGLINRDDQGIRLYHYIVDSRDLKPLADIPWNPD